MRKVALLAGAIMFALAVSGFTYAWWTDHVEIVAEITTGTFGWELTLEGDWVWGDEKEITTHWSDLIYDLDDDPNADKLVWEVLNLYPGILAELWWDVHFYGTVPGHIEDVYVELRVTEADGTETMYDETNIPDWLYILVKVKGTNPPDALSYLAGGSTKVFLADFIALLEGTQWHESNCLDVFTWIELIEPGMDLPAGVPEPLSEPPQDAVIRLEIGIDGIQYNAENGPWGPPAP